MLLPYFAGCNRLFKQLILAILAVNSYRVNFNGNQTNKAIKLSQKHLLGIQDLSINDIKLILDEAQTFIRLTKVKTKNLTF